MAALLAAAIMAATGAGCGARAPLAYAAEGSITINQRANAGASYTMYQVFVADISEKDVATHIAWNAGNKGTVLSFLDSDTQITGAPISYSAWLMAHNRTGNDAHDNAQNAAEYISETISSSADAAMAGHAPIKRSGTFAENFGQHLAAHGTPDDPETAMAGAPYTNAEGYYLAVTSPTSLDGSEAGSAPMWIPLGGSMQTIDAKEEAPMLEINVMDDRTGSTWGKAADACPGQNLAFRVRGSVPSTIGAYDRYHDRYVVTLPPGMALAANGASPIIVRAGGADVTERANIECVDGVLAIDIDDAKALDCPQGLEGVEISFEAHLEEEAAIGEAGNAVAVDRTYTADPVTLVERAAARQTAYVYAYEAQIVKVDKSNGERLAGAKFSIRASDGTAHDKNGLPSAQAPSANTDAESAGKFLQSDGSLGDDPHEFETNDKGEVLVPAVDEGVYVVRETSAPEGYELQDTDIILTIASELDQNEGTLTSLSARMTGGEAASVDGDSTSRLLSVSKTTGTVCVQAADDRMLEMAGTGLQGNGALLVAAGVLAGMGTTGLAATGRKRNGRK